MSKLIAILVVISFVHAEAWADFYVSTSEKKNILQSRQIEAEVVKGKGIKLKGAIDFEQKRHGQYNINIRWQDVYIGSKTYDGKGLVSKFSAQGLTIAKGVKLLVKGKLPSVANQQLLSMLDKEAMMRTAGISSSSGSKQEDREGVNVNTLGGNDPINPNDDNGGGGNDPINPNDDNGGGGNDPINPNDDNGGGDIHIPGDPGVPGNPGNNGRIIVVDNTGGDTPDPTSQEVRINTGIENCQPIYNPDTSTVDIMVRDYYHNPEGDKVYKGNCYKLRTTSAIYKDCGTSIDWDKNKTTVLREAYFTYKKDQTDAGEEYAASGCLPYHEYINSFGVADSNCSSLIDKEQRVITGRWYYSGEDGARHYVSDCIADPKQTPVNLKIDFAGCSYVANDVAGYIMQMGQYFYIDSSNKRVNIAGCADLGAKSQFKYQYNFVKWQDQPNQADPINGYTVAIVDVKATLPTVGEIVVHENYQYLKIYHELEFTSWSNHDINNAPSAGIPYSQKNYQVYVELPAILGQSATRRNLFVYQEAEHINHIIDGEEYIINIDGFKASCHNHQGEHDVHYQNIRPDGSKYDNRVVERCDVD